MGRRLDFQWDLRKLEQGLRQGLLVDCKWPTNRADERYGKKQVYQKHQVEEGLELGRRIGYEEADWKS